MKAFVDESSCIGCEHCVNDCPDVFAMEGEYARVMVDVVPPDLEKDCAAAAENCPVGAITTA